MRLIAPSFNWSAYALCPVVLCAVLIAPPLSAENPATPVPTATTDSVAAGEKQVNAQPLALDLRKLIFDANQGRMNDPVWQLQPRTGREIRLLPLQVVSVDAEATVSRPPAVLRGGRFIGFSVPPRQQHQQGDELDLAALESADAEALNKLLFEDDAAALNDSGGDKAELPFVLPLPQGAPRLARELVFTPEGTVKWKLDRGFSSAELARASDSNPYPYKLDPQQLRDAEPPRPERIERRNGESSRDYAQRRREASERQREAMQTFRALRDRLRDLPEEFVAHAPDVVYAVFEVRQGDPIALEGDPPLPWTLRPDDVKHLESVARGGGQGLNEEQAASLDALGRMVSTRQPMAARAAALAVVRGRLANAIEPGGPAYRLIESLLASPDPLARRLALYALVRSDDKSIATANLLASAGPHAATSESDAIQLAALRTLFAIEAAKPGNTAQLIKQVNDMLADPAGLAGVQVINELLAAADGLARGRGADAYAQAAPAMINQIDLARLPEAERAAVIDRIIQRAPASPIAAGWVDVKLLGGGDAALTRQTLDALVKASAADQVEAAMQPQLANEADSEKPAPAIPIASAEHGLIALINSPDPDRSAQAWRALPGFRVVKPSTPDSADTGEKVLDSILAKAMDQAKTPDTLVAFLVNHRGTELSGQAMQALVRLMLEPKVDAEVQKLAAQAMVGTDRSLSQAVDELEDADKAKWVASLYKQLMDEAPLITGIAADPSSRALPWLVERLGEGDLPTARDWATHAGEQQLLQLAGSENAVVASSAAGGLALIAGGTNDDQLRFAGRVGQMAERTQDKVQEAWSQLKTQLNAEALGRAQGSYNFVVTRRPAQAPQGEAAAPPMRTRVGVVDLKAEGTNVSLSVEAVAVTVTDEQLALRIASIASLRTFASPDLADLPYEELDRPLDLLPQDDGSWVGQTDLPGGGTLEVALEPVE